MNAAMAKIALAVAGAALVGGCAGMRDHRGAVVDPELVSAIQPAIDNKTSVAATLGRPTFEGQFSDNDWYYVSRDTKTIAFRNPSVQKQTVVHVRFDAAGNVVSVNQTGKELVANIDPVDDKTPTLGRDRSLFEDIFGNIGTLGTAAPGAGQQPQ
ncbi:MAG TPA: outer membrane protein assembly factor BamE [Sphingomicrobium sp.]|nr:outer membrane protein assembly factor BamE [Sphingomicrobium sp.]